MAVLYNHILINVMIFLFINPMNNAVISIFVYKSLSIFLIIPTARNLEVELGQSLNNLRFLITSVKLTSEKLYQFTPPLPVGEVPVLPLPQYL